MSPSPTERLAYFLQHGVSDADFLAKVVGVDSDVFREKFVYVLRKQKANNLADQLMRLDAGIRSIDSAEWRRLDTQQQLDRSLFLIRTFNA